MPETIFTRMALQTGKATFCPDLSGQIPVIGLLKQTKRPGGTNVSPGLFDFTPGIVGPSPLFGART